MREAYLRQSIDYYGAQIPVCQLANIRQVDDTLVVRPFDPSCLEALVQAGRALGWSFEVGEEIIFHG